jgi:hypothetical protein
MQVLLAARPTAGIIWAASLDEAYKGGGGVGDGAWRHTMEMFNLVTTDFNQANRCGFHVIMHLPESIMH